MSNEFKWEGTLPDVTREFDFTPAMKRAAEISYDSIMKTFAAGGRPLQWPGLKSGGASHLERSGNLIASIERTWTEKSWKVWTSTAKIRYALIHQVGGRIRHPGSDKFQVFPGSDGAPVFTHYTKPHTIEIQPRPYMLYQEEDIIQFHDLIKDVPINWFNTRRKKLGTQS